tara:strand:- start:3653 stop:3886 length:234 start_codon:yes stop_codon:yes gene_type:complete
MKSKVELQRDGVLRDEFTSDAPKRDDDYMATMRRNLMLGSHKHSFGRTGVESSPRGRESTRCVSPKARYRKRKKVSR